MGGATGGFEPVRAVLRDEIASGRLPGVVWLVSCRGDDHVEAMGALGPGTDRPMQRDTIFRITSMTKAVTAVAVLMLAEDGRLALDDRADRLLPELANRRVLRTPESPLDDTVPATTPLTVRQLMDFTFGLGLVFDATLPIARAADERELRLGPPVPMTSLGPDEWIRRLGELPLMHPPGERWMYNVGSLVLGVLVRRAARTDLDAFVAERILEPLGMRDTGFSVPASKLDRFAGSARVTDPTGASVPLDADGAASAFARRPIFPSGAAGLCSTADDWLAFARFLLAGGEHRGRRLLRPESVGAMVANQLTDAQRTASARSLFPGLFDAHGWGFGVRVSLAGGDYGWDGGFGTSWFNDPRRGLVSIALTQSPDFLFRGGLERYRAALDAVTG